MIIDSDPNLAPNRPGNVDRATLKRIYQTLTKNPIPLDKNGDPISFSPPNHQPEHLYAKPPCPNCQAKQAQIDTLRTALAGIMGGDDTARLDHVEAAAHRGRGYGYSCQDALVAVKALRETKP
jgi:hypothetical protein